MAEPGHVRCDHCGGMFLAADLETLRANGYHADTLLPPDWHDPIAGNDRGPCPDYAPDTLAPDPADRDVCTTCYYRAADHTAEVPA